MSTLFREMLDSWHNGMPLVAIMAYYELSPASKKAADKFFSEELEPWEKKKWDGLLQAYDFARKAK